MWPDQVSNPGPLTYESGALPTALRGPAGSCRHQVRDAYILYRELRRSLSSHLNLIVSRNEMENGIRKKMTDETKTQKKAK